MKEKEIQTALSTVHSGANAQVNDLLVTSINIVHKQQGLPRDQSEIERHRLQDHTVISLVIFFKLTSV